MILEAKHHVVVVKNNEKCSNKLKYKKNISFGINKTQTIKKDAYIKYLRNNMHDRY